MADLDRADDRKGLDNVQVGQQGAMAFVNAYFCAPNNTEYIIAIASPSTDPFDLHVIASIGDVNAALRPQDALALAQVMEEMIAENGDFRNKYPCGFGLPDVILGLRKIARVVDCTLL